LNTHDACDGYVVAMDMEKTLYAIENYSKTIDPMQPFSTNHKKHKTFYLILFAKMPKKQPKEIDRIPYNARRHSQLSVARHY
jgi:hypothetical protein